MTPRRRVLSSVDSLVGVTLIAILPDIVEIRDGGHPNSMIFACGRAWLARCEWSDALTLRRDPDLKYQTDGGPGSANVRLILHPSQPRHIL